MSGATLGSTSSTKDFVDSVRAAEVRLDVDGEEATVMGGPFRMPVTVNGVHVLVNATKSWISLRGQAMSPKDVRLELADASRPFYDPGRFVFTIKNYRWRVMNYQHTWMGIAVNQVRLYIHADETLASALPPASRLRSRAGLRSIRRRTSSGLASVDNSSTTAVGITTSPKILGSSSDWPMTIR